MNLNQSVERALAALMALEDGPRRVSELSDILDLGQSTVSRLMLTMESGGFVTRDTLTGGYRLGSNALTIGGAMANQHPVHRASRVIAQRAAQEHDVGVYVGIRDVNRVQYLLSFEGDTTGKPVTMVGQHKPLHATGLGKCLLLGVQAAQRLEFLGQLGAFTSNTITTVDRLQDELERTDQQGFAIENEELALGRACVAAPIWDSSGGIAAAISVSGTTRRMDLANNTAHWAGLVIEMADAVSTNLGFTPGRTVQIA